MGGLAPSTLCRALRRALAVAVVSRSSHPVIGLSREPVCGLASTTAKARCVFRARLRAGAALARKEPVFADIAYRDKATARRWCWKADTRRRRVVTKVAEDCGLKPAQLTFIYAPTQSSVGSAQIVARALEVAMHKVHELKFPLDRVVEGMAAAPLSPPHPDFVTAMGRTNDAIIYGGQVHLISPERSATRAPLAGKDAEPGLAPITDGRSPNLQGREG